MSYGVKPAPVTPLVEQLAAQAGLGYPQAGYILDQASPVANIIGCAFVLMIACFWALPGVAGLVFIAPAFLQELLHHTWGKNETELAMTIAGAALFCLLLGLHLLKRFFAELHRIFDSEEWYICPAGFVIVKNGKGEAVRWDQIEDYDWDTEPDSDDNYYYYWFRRSDGKMFSVGWSVDTGTYVDKGYELLLAIENARGSKLNPPPGRLTPRQRRGRRALKWMIFYFVLLIAGGVTVWVLGLIKMGVLPPIGTALAGVAAMIGVMLLMRRFLRSDWSQRAERALS